jgi:hypothetical protein
MLTFTSGYFFSYAAISSFHHVDTPGSSACQVGKSSVVCACAIGASVAAVAIASARKMFLIIVFLLLEAGP